MSRNFLPSLECCAQLATAGCHLAMPQKSPIAAQTRSGEAETSMVFLTVRADAPSGNVRSAAKAMAKRIPAATFMLPPDRSPSRRYYRMNGCPRQQALLGCAMPVKTIGPISDTHGLLRPEAVAALQGSDHIIHAGDIGDPKILDALRRIAPLTAIR